MRLTIRTRLTLWYAAVLVTTGGVLLVTVYLLARRQLFSANSTLLLKLVPAVAADPSQTVIAGPAQPAQDLDTAAALINSAREETLRAILYQSALLFAALAAVSLVVCWLVASRALRPLRTVTAVAERLSHDTLSERITHDGPADELHTLVEAFNTMLDRLGRAFQAQRLFAANASHELRTPLTIIQTAAEKALSRPHRTEADYRRAFATVITAAHRSERLLASLLALARAGQHTRHETVDLAHAATEAARAAPPAGPTVHTALHPAPVDGDPAQLELLLRNLVDNAVRHNTDGGTVWIRTDARAGTAVLTVENTGPHLDNDDIGRLRRAFQRGGGRTGGHGLGLAIVDAVVDAHTGTWTATPRPSGGLTVEVRLPAAG
ncbi:two-component sensor histidine kinase [Virgisporangium aliadipatigenens]|uniref:histidine kinase n=1 Tax=Virgisporangium aliadipatigenens TaxID=741659 RepID=A0A8J3YKD3_9ACTN|nr:HAMP domain-containing sensor histidine kinase [Virgisporangium aliadipatigenens]GIJ45575.1 two-component sensor histidine kinase [Virgisporangium aliadipatigenens]